MRNLLLVLPYVGLVLSTVSAIWGLTQEPYTKDENNKRHLTRAGRYAIAFILLGLFISFNTGILKFFTDNQDRENARQEAARKDQQTTLEKLAQQQLDEARDQASRDRDRTAQEKLDREAQERRDNNLAQQQRDLELSQQQLQGFGRAEALARQQTLAELHEISRTLQSLDNLVVSLGFSVSLENSDMRPYVERVEPKLEAMAVQHNQEKIWKEDNVFGKTDTPGIFHILANSSLLPDNSSEEAKAYQTLSRLTLFAGFYKSPVDVNKWETEFAAQNFPFTLPRSVFFTEPDMDFGIHLSIETGDLYLQYDKPNNRVIQRANNRSITSLGQPTGKILSFVDLPGSTVVIIIHGRAIKESLQCLQITLPKGKTAKIEGSKVRRIDGYNVGIRATYFFYTFPSNPDLFTGSCSSLDD